MFGTQRKSNSFRMCGCETLQVCRILTFPFFFMTMGSGASSLIATNTGPACVIFQRNKLQLGSRQRLVRAVASEQGVMTLHYLNTRLWLGNLLGRRDQNEKMENYLQRCGLPGLLVRQCSPERPLVQLCRLCKAHPLESWES